MIKYSTDIILITPRKQLDKHGRKIDNKDDDRSIGLEDKVVDISNRLLRYGYAGTIDRFTE